MQSFQAMSVSALCDHIERTHHDYIVHELPRLQHFVGIVSEAHGHEDERLYEIADVFDALCKELSARTQQENEHVFPLLRTYATDPTTVSIDTVVRAIERANEGRENIEASLHKLHTLTQGYEAPEDACWTYVTTWEQLEAFAQATRDHMYQESFVLFPKVIS